MRLYKSCRRKKRTSTYCGWKKSCITLDGWNPIDNGMFITYQHLSTGAGFRNHRIKWCWPGVRRYHFCISEKKNMISPLCLIWSVVSTRLKYMLSSLRIIMDHIIPCLGLKIRNTVWNNQPLVLRIVVSNLHLLVPSLSWCLLYVVTRGWNCSVFIFWNQASACGCTRFLREPQSWFLKAMNHTLYLSWRPKHQTYSRLTSDTGSGQVI